MGAQGKTPSLKNGIILNGKWEIIEHIATGGKGEVYRARQTNLDREVVVKTISKEYLGELDGDDEYIETELLRFHREALAMAKVRNPHIVQVYDQDEAVVTLNGIQESVQYLVMEYIDGPSLRSTMPSEGFCANERQAREWIKKYFLPVLDGIQSVHELDIVHRDLKPENVLLDNSTPKIMDFGIAGGARWSQLTKSHHVEGTITYMAPEQFMDLGETDVRADVYALGKILYEAVIGTMDKKTAFLLKGACLQAAESPFWKRVDRIIQDATTEDPDQRIPSAKALREQLEALLEDFDETKFHFMGVAFPRPDRRQVALGIAAILFIIGLIVGSNLVHHVIMVDEEQVQVPGRTSVAPVLGEEGTKSGEVKTTSHASIIGRDGSELRYVSGGRFTLPPFPGSKSAESFWIAPFYMASTEVTNEQYVKFLNTVLNKVSVENAAVKSGGQTWVKLGEAFSGYEPIVFENGRFSLKNSRYRFYPVVRVTGYGASAYARFYEEQLPTELEWYAAIQTASRSLGNPVVKDSKSDSKRQTDLEQEMDGLVGLYGVLDKPGAQSSTQSQVPAQVPHEVSKFPENKYGIRGLRANVGEWGLRILRVDGKTQYKTEYVILGDLEGTWMLGTTLIRGPQQDPSEARVSVGFRVSRRAEPHKSGQERKNAPQK